MCGLVILPFIRVSLYLISLSARCVQIALPPFGTLLLRDSGDASCQVNLLQLDWNMHTAAHSFWLQRNMKTTSRQTNLRFFSGSFSCVWAMEGIGNIWHTNAKSSISLGFSFSGCIHEAAQGVRTEQVSKETLIKRSSTATGCLVDETGL